MSFYAIDPDLARALLREPLPDAPAAPALESADGSPDQGSVAVLVCAFAAMAMLSAMVPWS